MWFAWSWVDFPLYDSFSQATDSDLCSVFKIYNTDEEITNTNKTVLFTFEKQFVKIGIPTN